MSQMGGRDHKSEARAEKHCLGLRIGGGSRRSDVGVSSRKTSRRRRDRCDRRIGKAYSSCRSPSNSGSVGNLGGAIKALVLKPPVDAGAGACRGASSSGVVGSSRRCTGEVAVWGA